MKNFALLSIYVKNRESHNYASLKGVTCGECLSKIMKIKLFFKY